MDFNVNNAFCNIMVTDNLTIIDGNMMKEYGKMNVQCRYERMT